MAATVFPARPAGTRSRFKSFPGPAKNDLEIAGIRRKPWLVKPVVNHLVVHSPETAATFLDAMKEREALSENRVAGTGTIFPGPQLL